MKWRLAALVRMENLQMSLVFRVKEQKVVEEEYPYCSGHYHLDGLWDWSGGWL